MQRVQQTAACCICMEGLEDGPDPSDYQLNLDYWHRMQCPPGQKPVIAHIAKPAQGSSGPGIIHWTCYTCANKINAETGRYSVEVCPLCRDTNVKLERRNAYPMFSINPQSPPPAQNSNMPPPAQNSNMSPLPTPSGWWWWPTRINNSAQHSASAVIPERTNAHLNVSNPPVTHFPSPQHLLVEFVADPYPMQVVNQAQHTVVLPEPEPEPEPPVVQLVRYESVQLTNAIQNAQDEEREYQREWEAVRQSDRERRQWERQAQEAAEAVQEAAEGLARQTQERHRIQRVEHAQQVEQARLDQFHKDARQKRTRENRYRGVFYREQALQKHHREAEETAEQLRTQHREEERMQRNRIVF